MQKSNSRHSMPEIHEIRNSRCKRTGRYFYWKFVRVPVQVADRKPVTFSTLWENNRVLCHIRARGLPVLFMTPTLGARDRINGIVDYRQKSCRRDDAPQWTAWLAVNNSQRKLRYHRTGYNFVRNASRVNCITRRRLRNALRSVRSKQLQKCEVSKVENFAARCIHWKQSWNPFSVEHQKKQTTAIFLW